MALENERKTCHLSSFQEVRMEDAAVYRCGNIRAVEVTVVRTKATQCKVMEGQLIEGMRVMVDQFKQSTTIMTNKGIK